MAFWNRKNKEDEVHKGDLMVADGIYLKQATMKNGHIILNCFLRALIVFFLVFGSICGFLSAFNINYNLVMVVSVFLLLSMYFSFLYASSKFIYRDLGYVIFFALFVFAIYMLRIYANSGFYVIVNSVLDRAKNFFELPGVRQYEVEIDNDLFTVSIVVCFIGMLIIIILNIWMYSIMSMFWTVLFTFPILFIPIYMKLTISPIYMICLAIGYFAVTVFKANGHYVVFAWDTPFKTRGIIKKRVSYTQDSGIFRQIIGSLLIMSTIVVIIVETVFNPMTFEGRFKNNRLWNYTSEAIGNFLLLGISSMFNQYPNTGGMSGGKLGGISNVRPDYLTDLVVSFVPYGNDAIYLKGYTGGIYGDNQWLSLYDESGLNGKDDQTIFEEESLRQEMLVLKNNWGRYSGNGFMRIKNVGADTAYLYYPYYTKFGNYSIYNNHNLLSSTQGLSYGQEVDYNFYPKIVWEEKLGNTRACDIDISDVNPVFLDVPEKNEKVIADICDEIGLDKNMTENDIVDAVAVFFSDNYPYTLRPGQTPRDEDFINYFLTTNKKGYCAHFASSAVLIFRHMGIPARYVEGYAFSMESVFASDEAEDLIASDFYSGYSAIGDAPVMKVEVSDAQAHAWVEVYIDGFGWRNVEVTPGSNEVTEEDDFWSAFAQALQGNLGNNNDSANNGLNLNDLELSRFAWIIYMILGIIAFGILLVVVRVYIRKIRRYVSCHQSDMRDAVIARYADICDMIRVCDADFDGCRSHKEQLQYMKDRYAAPDDVEDVKEHLEKMSFHDEYLEEEQIGKLCDMISFIRKQIVRNAGFKTRFALWKR